MNGNMKNREKFVHVTAEEKNMAGQKSTERDKKKQDREEWDKKK
jgi:hypothetical protein